jgi:hypothetical protein
VLCSPCTVSSLGKGSRSLTSRDGTP